MRRLLRLRIRALFGGLLALGASLNGCCALSGVAHTTDAWGEQDIWTQPWVASTLGRVKSGDRTALERLVDGLRQNDRAVRHRCARALVEYGPAAFDELAHRELTIDPWVKSVILTKMGPGACSSVLDSAKQHGGGLWDSVVIESLAMTGEPAIDAAIAGLRSESVWVRYVAVEVLGRLRAKRAGKALAVAAMAEANWIRADPLGEFFTHRPHYLWALTRLSDPELSWFFHGMLAGRIQLATVDPGSEREVATRAMGLQEDPQYLPALVYELEHGASEVAAIALGRLGDPRAGKHLWAALDANHELEGPILWALARLGDSNVAQRAVEILDANVLSGLQGVALNALAKLGDQRGVDMALGMLDGPDREYVIEALALLKARKAVPRLKALLHPNYRHYEMGFMPGPPEWLQESLIEALGLIGGEESIRALGEVLGDREGYWARPRMIAAIALGKTGDEKAVEELKIGLDDRDELVRSQSARGLLRIGTDSAKAALKGLETDFVLSEVLGGRFRYVWPGYDDD